MSSSLHQEFNYNLEKHQPINVMSVSTVNPDLRRIRRSPISYDCVDKLILNTKA